MERNSLRGVEHAGGNGGWWPVGGFDPRQPMDGDLAGYRLGARLDEFGEIFEGFHPRIRSPFVIKLFGHLTGSRPAAVEAFSSEAGRISLLRHPNVAQVFNAGTFKDGTPFVAMERLEGLTLEEHLTFRGPLPLSRLLPVLRGVVSALSAAHAAGVVHSEIRPDNVFLVDVPDGEPPQVKLLDFGVSRLTWAEGPAGRGISVDDARYLAPEQASGDMAEVDPRADQFAVAALICRVMHGTALLSKNPVAKSDRVAEPESGSDTPLAHRASALKLVLLRALSERPLDRYLSVAAFLEDLERSLAGSASVSGTTFVPRAEQWARQEVSSSTVTTDSGFAFTSFKHVPRERNTLAVVVMVALMGVGSFAAWGAPWWSPSNAWQENRFWRTVQLLRAGLPRRDLSPPAPGPVRPPIEVQVATSQSSAGAAP